jgi:ubiquinone/menaquinone biosynthesis C-methylase UbiE
MLDIVEPCLSVKNFIKLDVQQKLPFPNEFFDGVVMAEVIEHLFHDVSTLKEIHRVLKPDGILAMTVPYLHDEPEYHVRVHTYNSVRRLIEFCGFRIEEHFYRGIVCALPNKNFFTMLFFYFPFILTSINPRMFQKVMKFYFLLEVLIGKKLPRLQKFWPSYGGILKAVKSSPKDFLEVQIKSFGTK